MGSQLHSITGEQAIEAAKLLRDYCAEKGCRKCIFGKKVKADTWRCLLDPMPVLWDINELRREELPSNGCIHYPV